MEAKVTIVVTNLKEFHELYQELRQKEKELKEVLEKIEKFNLKVTTKEEPVEN